MRKISLDNATRTIMMFVVSCRNRDQLSQPGFIEMKAANREILLSFWKVHILHHANVEPVHGQWILTELRRHGYDISPGTLYPLLNRMERLGWLRCKADPDGGRRARKDYRLTSHGRKVLALIRQQLQELYEEVVLEGGHKSPRI
jgi:DNA-binding PadR family transcriptional regulator